MIKMYSTHCPKCKILETKLKQKNIEYEECTDISKRILSMKNVLILTKC